MDNRAIIVPVIRRGTALLLRLAPHGPFQQELLLIMGVCGD